MASIVQAVVYSVFTTGKLPSQLAVYLNLYWTVIVCNRLPILVSLETETNTQQRLINHIFSKFTHTEAELWKTDIIKERVLYAKSCFLPFQIEIMLLIFILTDSCNGRGKLDSLSKGFLSDPRT